MGLKLRCNRAVDRVCDPFSRTPRGFEACLISRCTPLRLRLSAEPLVGLKLEDGPQQGVRGSLSAEPLVGLKQHRAVLYGAVLYGFQPNPSWV